MTVPLMMKRPMADAHPTPLCNTGVHPLTGTDTFAVSSHFDWYRATVPIHHDLLTRELLKTAGKYAQVTEGPGRFSYKASRTIEHGRDRVATILYGGSNGHPNVEASGGVFAPRLAGSLRAMGPHKVTRCDVAVDLFGDGLFDALKALGGDVADQHGIDCRDVVNRDPAKGDTRYLGSRQSSVFARIYEKGKSGGWTTAQVPADLLSSWVRLELEIKPQKSMKEVAAATEPEAFWGVSPWTRQLAKGALGMNAQILPFHPRRETTDERAFQTMLSQYGAICERRLRSKHEGNIPALLFEMGDGLFPSSYPDEQDGNGSDHWHRLRTLIDPDDLRQALTDCEGDASAVLSALLGPSESKEAV